jgi:hypothetical protein
MTIDLFELVASNPFGPGSPFSNQSATNPFATETPGLLARLSGLSGSFSFFRLFGSFGFLFL